MNADLRHEGFLTGDEVYIAVKMDEGEKNENTGEMEWKINFLPAKFKIAEIRLEKCERLKAIMKTVHIVNISDEEKFRHLFEFWFSYVSDYHVRLFRTFEECQLYCEKLNSNSEICKKCKGDFALSLDCVWCCPELSEEAEK